jgi:tRNA threonylcarbamoyladenosine biosynthesis protein TsaB
MYYFCALLKRMAVILHIETSTSVCSVALSDGETCIAEKSSLKGPSHNELLSPFIQEMLDIAKEKQVSIDAVAISEGPGSYTGLRIGTATAKGLCFGFDIPLIAVNTLEIIAKAALNVGDIEKNTLLCPMIDARRMEVYTSFFNEGLQMLQPVSAEIIDENSFAEILNKQKILFCGDGAEKCKAALTHPNALFANNIHPLAKNMITAALKKFEQQIFADIAYFEPFYLKEFIATTPKNKVLF